MQTPQELREKMYEHISSMTEKMRAKYPKELNMDGLEPALTSDISEICLKIQAESYKQGKKEGYKIGCEGQENINSRWKEIQAETRREVAAQVREEVIDEAIMCIEKYMSLIGIFKTDASRIIDILNALRGEEHE